MRIVREIGSGRWLDLVRSKGDLFAQVTFIDMWEAIRTQYYNDTQSIVAKYNGNVGDPLFVAESQARQIQLEDDMLSIGYYEIVPENDEDVNFLQNFRDAADELVADHPLIASLAALHIVNLIRIADGKDELTLLQFNTRIMF